LEGRPPLMVFNSQEDGVAALDPQDGHRAWQLDRVLDKRSVSSPVIAGGIVTASCGSGAGGNYVVALRPPQSPGAAPTVAYEIRRSAPYVPTPLALGDLLFLWSDGGIVTCVDAATGREHWQQRVRGNYFSSPVCADGKLYGVSTTGEVVVLAASKEFKELGRSALGETSHATPAIAGGRIYFRSLSQLLVVGRGK
jgi:outer membrane protein assembly factor BamB